MEVSAHVCDADLRYGQRPARGLELAPLLGVWHATDRGETPATGYGASVTASEAMANADNHFRRDHFYPA